MTFSMYHLQFNCIFHRCAISLTQMFCFLYILVVSVFLSGFKQIAIEKQY